MRSDEFLDVGDVMELQALGSPACLSGFAWTVEKLEALDDPSAFTVTQRTCPATPGVGALYPLECDLTITAVRAGTATLQIRFGSLTKEIRFHIGRSLKLTSIRQPELNAVDPPSLSITHKTVIQYEVGAQPLDRVWLEVRNARRDPVFLSSDLSGSPGVHETVWDMRWNQDPYPPYIGPPTSNPHPGPFYPNPNNGPYEIAIVGILKKGGMTYTMRDVTSKSLTLTVEATVTDAAADTASRSSGLSDLASALNVAVTTTGFNLVLTNATDFIVTPLRPGDYSSVHIAVVAPELNSLPDGRYSIGFFNLRDVVGNVAQDRNGTDAPYVKLELK